MTAPKCLFCFGDIKKKTKTIYFVRQRKTEDGSWFRYVETPEPPRTKADCQRYTNDIVVSVKRNHTGDSISFCSTWDRSSYVDEYFCNGDHAKRFAYQAARAGFRCK